MTKRIIHTRGSLLRYFTSDDEMHPPTLILLFTILSTYGVWSIPTSQPQVPFHVPHRNPDTNSAHPEYRPLPESVLPHPTCPLTSASVSLLDTDTGTGLLAALRKLIYRLFPFLEDLGREPDIEIIPVPAPPDERADDITKGWVDPRVNGGRLLDFTTPKYGEPLNVIISGKSDEYVLNEEGFRVYAKSISFSSECLGLHYGNIHSADLGDGDGKKDEQYLARQDYFPIWGTCWESLAGGNHFRAWHQNGTLASTNAWFLAVSKEEHSGRNHKIVPDGYNLGRNHLVSKAIAGSRWAGKWWKAEVEWRMGLLEKGKEGVNHGIEQDGLVAILTINRL